jgi:hypothetical protein
VKTARNTEGPSSAIENGLLITKIDITVENAGGGPTNSLSHLGWKSTENTIALLSLFPFLFPLMIVLKKYLAARQYNNTYTGGISSYSLLVMLTAFIIGYVQPIALQSKQLGFESPFSQIAVLFEPHVSKGDPPMAENESPAELQAHRQRSQCYPVLLRAFLQFYGRDFNSVRTGITLHPDLQYKNRNTSYLNRLIRHGAFQPYFEILPGTEGSGHVTILDPVNYGKNMTQNAYLFSDIQKAFAASQLFLDDLETKIYGILSNRGEKHEVDTLLKQPIIQTMIGSR